MQTGWPPSVVLEQDPRLLMRMFGYADGQRRHRAEQLDG